MIIDFHTHILPSIDDGSRNIENSIIMLQEEKKQGTDVVICTPHFYAWEHRINSWLTKREDAYLSISNQDIKLLLGAEVAFFDGISRASMLDQLTIGNSNLLLLEMPFGKWEQSFIDEVEYLIYKRKFRIILAHLERFMISHNEKYIKQLLKMDLYVQINAEAFDDWKIKGKVIRMFKRKEAHFLGSDAHGVHHRVVNLKTGRDAIEKKLGSSYLSDMDKLGEEVLEGLIDG